LAAHRKRPRSLRSELTQAILVVMVVAVIALFGGIFWVTIPAFSKAVRDQLKMEPFLEAQRATANGLADLGQLIVQDSNFQLCVVRDGTAMLEALDELSEEELLKPTPEIQQRLDRIRSEKLNNLWEQAQRILLRQDISDAPDGLYGFASKADLLVLVDDYGRAWFQMVSEHDPKAPELIGRVTIRLPLSASDNPRPDALALHESSLVVAALENQAPYRSYQRYPDGQIYNMVAVPYQYGRNAGVLLLGERIGLQTATRTGRIFDCACMILSGGGFENGYLPPAEFKHQSSQDNLSLMYHYGSVQPGTIRLGTELARSSAVSLPAQGWLPVDYPSEVKNVTLAGTEYALLAQPLVDSPQAMEEAVSLEVKARPAPPVPTDASQPKTDKVGPVLGWVVLLKPTTEVAAAALNQQLFILGVGGLAALLGIFLARPVSRHITGPILMLASKMRRVVEQGDLSPAEPEGSREIMEAGEAFNQMVAGLRQKDVLEKFVPEETRAEVAQEGRLVLGQAQRVTATVMFSDLRGFTSLSERLDPSELVEILGEYLKRMTAVVLQNNGSIYEYIGDAILAVFRDREDGASGAVQSVRAALAMHRELQVFQDSSAHPEVKAMRQGIGLNTGLLVDGNIGMEERAKRAVIGDTVNLAARIQDRSRDGKHTDILVSQPTYEATRGEFEFEFFGEELFKGKSQPEKVWEVLRERQP
jgi:class 3 adenylate cyclase